MGKSIKPPALKPGDCIGVMSTSCWVNEEDIQTAASFIGQKGFRTFIHPQTAARLQQSAGTAEEKVAAFNALFENDDIHAIFGSRGGNRAITMLDKIDFTAVKKNPKIFVGYSDMTVLLNAIYKKTGLITFHGPLFRELPKIPDLDKLIALLTCNERRIDIEGNRPLKQGEAEGVLIGGNLSLMQTLAGTSYAPDMKGAILFLEDVGDHLSRYDRMLAHLRMAGWFEQISGLIIGSFSDVQDDADRPFGFSLEDILLEHTHDLDIPVVMNAPFGHGGRQVPLPVGCRARLQVKNSSASLELTERPVS